MSNEKEEIKGRRRNGWTRGEMGELRWLKRYAYRGFIEGGNVEMERITIYMETMKGKRMSWERMAGREWEG